MTRCCIGWTRSLPGTLGWREPPEYEWIPLADLSELEKAEIDASRGKAAGQALNDGWTDEDEVTGADVAGGMVGRTQGQLGAAR